MSDDAVQLRLQEASRLFQNRNYAECESTLRSIANKDPKIRHNIAIAHYLAKGGDVRSTIADLRREDGSSTVSLEYEGHETAHYNRAVLLAYNGRCEEAAATLRELLQLHNSIAVPVLGRALCLFQLVTNESTVAQKSIVKKPTVAAQRSKSDDDLVARIVSQYMVEFKKDPHVAKMLQMTFATDGSALHDLFKSGASPAERAVYYNDLGILAMGEGKLNVAALYFTKAIGLIGDSGSDVFTKHSMMFNHAVCCIHRQEYQAAMKALLVAQESMRTSPSLWLRLAQATLGNHLVFSANDAQETHDARQRELAGQLGKGNIFPGFPLLQLPEGTTVSNGDTRRVYLIVANRAAHNCISLLTNSRSLQEAVDSLTGDGRVHDFRTLQYAYVYAAASELLMENYAVTIKLASDLLAVRSRPINADVHAAALLYLSDAYCRVNRPQQALKVLSGAPLGELLVGAERTDGQQKQRTEALFVNLVIVHICNGSWKQAQALVASLVQKIGNQQNTLVGHTAALLQVYLDLAQGNREKVLEQLSKSVMLGVPAAH